MPSSAFGSGSAGAVLTSEDVQSSLLEPLGADSVVLAALEQARFGPDDVRPRGGDVAPELASPVITSSGVPVRVPKINALDVGAPFVAENELIPLVEIDYGELTLLPSTLRGLKVLHRMSSELGRHAVGNASGLISDALVRRVARALDAAFLAGTGTNGSIRGLLALDGTQRVAGVGSPTVDDLHDAVGLSLAADARPTAWFMSPRDLISLRKLRDTAGQYLLAPDPSQAGGYALLGMPVFTSTQLPTDLGATRDVTGAASTDAITLAAHGVAAGAAVRFSVLAAGALPVPLRADTTYYARDVTANTFKVAATPGGAAVDLTADGAGALKGSGSAVVLADMRQVVVARDEDLTVVVLAETFAAWDQVGIRVTTRWDIGALNADGIVVLDGVTA